jgi:peptidoglycan hydrolase-like protein with peptidoglycan-binding domain
MNVIDIQRLLKHHGFDPGPVDGKAGARTTNAVMAFQIANGLSADGRVGPLTEAALTGDNRPEAVGEVSLPPPPSPATGSWPLQKDCMTFYGGVGLNQKMLPLPYPMRLAWKKTVTVTRISVHSKVFDSAGRAFAKIATTFDAKDRTNLGLDLFGGSMNVRRMRGGSAYSMHAWGIAIDFDPERNQLQWDHGTARLARPDAVEFWKIWEAEGWISLGRAHDKDWMHVQAARPK